MTRFLVVRHGETAWNREQRIQGQLDSPLTSTGLRQAQATAQRLRDLGASRLVVSDLGRTVQTAEPIAGATGLAMELDGGLRERSFGIFEGSTRDEIRNRWPEHYASWELRDVAYAMPAGESLLALRDRVRARLDHIAASGAGTVIVVTHGGVLDMVYRIAAGVSLEAPRDWPLRNSSINTIEVSGEAWQMRNWGDVAHLPDAADDIA